MFHVVFQNFGALTSAVVDVVSNKLALCPVLLRAQLRAHVRMRSVGEVQVVLLVAPLFRLVLDVDAREFRGSWRNGKQTRRPVREDDCAECCHKNHWSGLSPFFYSKKSALDLRGFANRNTSDLISPLSQTRDNRPGQSVFGRQCLLAEQAAHEVHRFPV